MRCPNCHDSHVTEKNRVRLCTNCGHEWSTAKPEFVTEVPGTAI